MSRFSCYGAVDPNNPEAAGVCDRGGEIRKRRELRREMIWAGDRLVWNGMLVCRHHIDPPHPQDRLKLLPAPDPAPVVNPRPDLDLTSPEFLDSGDVPAIPTFYFPE